MGARTTQQHTTTHTQHQHSQTKHHTHRRHTTSQPTQHRPSSTTATFTHMRPRHEGAPPLQLTSARRGCSMASPRPSCFVPRSLNARTRACLSTATRTPSYALAKQIQPATAILLVRVPTTTLIIHEASCLRALLPPRDSMISSCVHTTK
jgi:hypothetical protein